MRKKIFIIHGYGIKDGIGWEAGGDLDTVASNVFYTIWAENEKKKNTGLPAVYGEDYDYDFVNYSEGLSHLVVHSGCDVYIPDFPIDALSPRLELLYLPDERVAPLINEFNKKLFELKLWMTNNAKLLGDYFKKIFNSAYKQKIKILEHPDLPSMKTAISVVDIVRFATELSIIMKKIESAQLKSYLESLAENLSGDKLKTAKNYILELMGGYAKEEQMDLLDSVDDILKIEESSKMDYSAKGRINYSDDFIIIAVESVAYALRNYSESKTLSYNQQNAEKLAASSLEVAGAISALFKNIKNISEEFLKKSDLSPETASLVEKIKNSATTAIESIESIKNTNNFPEGERKKLTVVLMEQASGKTVSGIKITFRKLLGDGFMEDPAGNKVSQDTVTVTTSQDGVAFVYYTKAKSDEKFQISATYDDIRYLMLPEEIISGWESSYAEEVLEEEEEESQIDRAMEVSLQLLEKQLRELAENDVNIASITDHHPYTPAVMELLKKLKDEGIIKELDIRASSRQEELPLEKQLCGANIVYLRYLAGTSYVNEGLAELNKLARLQDLHIEKVPLAISLSKLIGSKYSKVEMIQRLSKISDKKSLQGIMQTTGWADVVDDYEHRLSMVLPRTEASIAKLKLSKPVQGSFSKLISKFLSIVGVKNKIEMISCLSPFCDPKKNEPQINVASAIEYIVNKNKKSTDYFFYCYGSHILTMRKMNNKDERINLSTLSQFLGTRADGGHSAASTCRPLSNPMFPKKRLSDVKDENFLEYLNYLGQRVAENIGYNFEGFEMLDFKYSPALLENLEKIDTNLVEITLKKDWIRKKILVAKMPKIDYNNRDANPSFLQIANYLKKRLYKFDYLFLIQGPLSKIILANISDKCSDIDLVKVARSIGWSEDTGDKNFAIASPRRNKKIPKDLRFWKDEQFYELCLFLSQFIESGLFEDSGEPKWKIHSVLAPRVLSVPKDLEEYFGKLKYSIYEAQLISTQGKNLKVAVVKEPYVSGVKSPPFTVGLGLLGHFLHLKLLSYLIYIRYNTIYILNINDESRAISCAQVLKSTGGMSVVMSDVFCAIDRKSIVMPADFERVDKSNESLYIKTLLEKLIAGFGYKVSRVEKKINL